MGARSGRVTRCSGSGVGWRAAPEAGASAEWAEGRAPGQAGVAGATSLPPGVGRTDQLAGRSRGTGVPAASCRNRVHSRSRRPATASSGETPQAPRPPCSSQRRAPPPAPCAPARQSPSAPPPVCLRGQPHPSPRARHLPRSPGRVRGENQREAGARTQPSLGSTPRGEGTSAHTASARAPCTRSPSSRATPPRSGATRRAERRGPRRPAGLQASLRASRPPARPAGPCPGCAGTAC